MSNNLTDNAERETVVLRKYKEPVIRMLKELADNRQLSKVCRENLGGMKTERLTEIHTGARELTPYYLGKLVQGGLVSLPNILQGKRLEDLPEEDQVVLKKIFQTDEEANAVWRLKAKGINIVALASQLIGDEDQE